MSMLSPSKWWLRVKRRAEIRPNEHLLSHAIATKFTRPGILFNKEHMMFNVRSWNVGDVYLVCRGTYPSRTNILYNLTRVTDVYFSENLLTIEASTLSTSVRLDSFRDTSMYTSPFPKVSRLSTSSPRLAMCQCWGFWPREKTSDMLASLKRLFSYTEIYYATIRSTYLSCTSCAL